MWPELGRYAGPVLTAYAVSILLLIGLVLWSLRRSARIKRALEAQETRMAAKRKEGQQHG